MTVGGTIPSEDVEELKAHGVAEVFTPGASTQQAVEFIRARGPERASVSRRVARGTNGG